MLQTPQDIVFDDLGEMWDAKSPALAESLQASLRGDALVDYVVRNLGFVALCDHNGSISVRLRPKVVSQMAFGALLYWLHDRPVRRVLLSLQATGWSHELLPSREAAVQRLMCAIKFNADDREGDFLSRTRPFDALPPSSPLRALLNAWSESGGKYDRERLSPLLDVALDRRFVLVEGAQRSNSLFFKDVGEGLATLAEFWLAHKTVLRVEDQPDYAYGKWVSGIYREVLETGKPSLEEIDAVITWPENQRRSYRYRRLVVPFKGEGDSTLVLSATIVDPDVNLRRKPS